MYKQRRSFAFVFAVLDNNALLLNVVEVTFVVLVNCQLVYILEMYMFEVLFS